MADAKEGAMRAVSERAHVEWANFGLALLSMAAGCTDVLSFLGLGDVFTSAMTGNTVLLGIAIGQGNMLAASHSATALFGFVLGAALATTVYDFAGARLGTRSGLRLLFVLEILCVGGFAAAWSAGGEPVPESARLGIILLSAIGMGVQGVGARKINSSGISTIVFTSALISIVMSATNSVIRPVAGAPSRGSARIHIGTFAAYVCSAVLVGILAGHYVAWLVWIPMVAVLLALGFLDLAHRMERSAT